MSEKNKMKEDAAGVTNSFILFVEWNGQNVR